MFFALKNCLSLSFHRLLISLISSFFFLILFGLTYFWLSKHNFVSFKTLCALFANLICSYLPCSVARVLLRMSNRTYLNNLTPSNSFVKFSLSLPSSHFTETALSSPLTPRVNLLSRCSASFFTSKPSLLEFPSISHSCLSYASYFGFSNRTAQ